MHAVIISIGDELVLGQTVDTNGAYLSAQLAELGVMTRCHETVADERADIAEALRRACERAELVLVTGGLGPTDDDLTRFALADAMGCGLIEDAQAVAHIERFFAARNRTMHARNRVQAMRPADAALLSDPPGTAPGIHAKLNNTDVWVMPGVPWEMKAIWLKHVKPTLTAGGGRVIRATKLNTFGKGESDVAALLGGLAERDRNPLVGTTVAEGVVSVRVRSAFDDADEAQRRLGATVAAVRDALGDLVYGRDDETLAEVLGALLKARGEKLATAESCTGGMIGQMLTATAGSSDWYAGGWVTYSNDMKSHQLGVRPELIEQHGAVSKPVARTMAEGALEKSGADYALSVTGIAGPTGGTDEKPVGTVWLGLASRHTETQTHHRCLPGDRAAIRQRASLSALNLLRLQLIGG